MFKELRDWLKESLKALVFILVWAIAGLAVLFSYLIWRGGL